MPQPLDLATQSPAEILFGDLRHELKSTRTMLERFPDGRGDWGPHAKSMTLGRLATHVADIPNRGSQILESDTLELLGRQPIPVRNSAVELVSYFDANVAKLMPLIAAADLPLLEQPWTMRRGEHVIVSAPRRILLRTVLISHLIHHRAQLGVYYRLLDVPVPGMYGPSADEM